jgi:7-cyano-7-deazaguanine synthase
MTKTVLILSGGLDSSILAYILAKEQMHTVLALSVNYGQRHSKELESAAFIAKELGIQHEIADLSGIRRLLAGSALTSDHIPVPEGHYEAESMKQTVVPNRNMLLLSIAGAWAISQGARFLAYGAHSGDHAIYPDCRPIFTTYMEQALLHADWHQVELIRPFIALTKAEIVKRGEELEVPMHKTWSCYKGGEKHCGRCGTCVERKEAFYLAGVQDLTPYEA